MKSILVVEDEESLRLVIAEILTGAGYEVFGAGNGRQALNILKLIEVDLIITDILMPDMEGIEFIREVRSSKKQSLRIIAMSGGSSDADSYLQLAQRLGADHILEKPFTLNLILEAVLQIED